MRTIKLLLIDEKMNAVTVDVEQWQFRNLNIDLEKVKKHKSKSGLNKTVIEFLENSKKD